MPNKKDDGDYSVPRIAGPIVWDIPFPDNIAYVFTQEWECDGNAFETTEIGTAHPTEIEFQLMAESPTQHIGGNVLRWTRTYAIVPNKRDEFETFSYTFPGIVLGFSSAENFSKSRQPITETVTTRLEYEYFQTNEPLSIPKALRWYVYGQGGFGYPANDATFGYSVGNASTPTKDQYISEFMGTERVAETSQIQRWYGNIYQRVTRHVVLE